MTKIITLAFAACLFSFNAHAFQQSMFSSLMNRQKIVSLPSSSVNVNLFTLAGSPTRPVNLVFIIPEGMVIGSNSTTLPALDTGTGWVAGTTIRIINKGAILGMGGRGGTSGSFFDTPGFDGGPAISLGYSVMIDNSLGTIFGGGGGGGGGPELDIPNTLSCGGSGGGGQGYGTSLAGVMESCFSGKLYPTGVAGTTGSQAGPGTGGNGGSNYTAANGTTNAARGGDGGTWGSDGNSSASATGSYTNGTPATIAPNIGGKAVNLNGKSVRWLDGNTATKVKGPIL